jgi:transcriptional regulator with XRE-family HTH domain
VSGTHSPTVRRRRLALELRRLREAAQMTCEDVAQKLDCSASKISRIETGRVAVSPRDARDLLGVYGVADYQRDSLIQLARDSRQKGWWQAYGDAVQPNLATYLGLESAASEIRAYKISRIPGLLQTEDYTRALLATGKLRNPSTDQERQLAVLADRRRQATLSPPAVWAILDEAALRRRVGGSGVMRAQIEHLIVLAGMPDVYLQVMPFAGGAYPNMDLPFLILAFPDRGDPEVVCIGYSSGMLWIEDATEVDTYNHAFHNLQAAALSLSDSRALMESALKDL